MRRLLSFISCMVLVTIGCTAEPQPQIQVRSVETRLAKNPPEVLGRFALSFRVEMDDDVLVWQGGVNEAISRAVEIVTPRRTYQVNFYLSFDSTQSDDDVIEVTVQSGDREIFRGRFVTEFKD